jgi:beta,beta-carotene 9',10'-dioxygenase
VNAFEDGDDLVLDMVAYPNSTIIDDLYLSRLRAGKPVSATGSLTRFRIALRGSKSLNPSALCAEAVELPRINYAACAGRRHRFVWGAGSRSVADFLDSIVTIDTGSGESASWYEEACYPGEPAFVAAPASSTEDEGVLLSVVLDSRRGTSFLLVLDAGSLAELARAEVPHHIPFGFHGNYFARSDAAEVSEQRHR